MNVLVCGVGGQGVILFSNLVAEIALASGYDVKKSEVHGMAQRGGSVNTHVRFGDRVFSPLIEEGGADLLVAFEMLEAVRYVHFLASDGRMVYDPHRIDPLPVSLGAVERPDDEYLAGRIEARTAYSTPVSAYSIARDLGNARVQNVVMLGATRSCLGFATEACEAAIARLVKPDYVELNLRAYRRGVDTIRRERTEAGE